MMNLDLILLKFQIILCIETESELKCNCNKKGV